MAKVTLGVRVDEELAARLDAMAAELSVRASGARVTRSDAARIAMERGAAALEAELAGGSGQKGGKAKKK